MSEEKELKRMGAVVRAYKSTFSTHNGDVVLKDMIKTHFMLSTSHSPGDPYETAFREGERNVVIRILQRMNFEPKDFIKHINEIAEDNSADI